MDCERVSGWHAETLEYEGYVALRVQFLSVLTRSTDILNPPEIPVEEEKPEEESLMTEEEQRELDDLLGSDED